MAQHKVICSSLHLCFAPRFPARSRTHTASLIQASSDITQQSVIKAHTYLKVLEMNSCSNFKKCSWPETNKEDSDGHIANLEFATKLLTHSTLTALQPKHSLEPGTHTSTPSQSTRFSLPIHKIKQRTVSVSRHFAETAGSDCNNTALPRIFPLLQKPVKLKLELQVWALSLSRFKVDN